MQSSNRGDQPRPGGAHAVQRVAAQAKAQQDRIIVPAPAAADLPLLEQDYDTILLGFCLCGNALHGVRAARARLIAPRFDDCIRMLLCPAAGRPRPLIAAACTIRRPGLATAARSWTNTTRLWKNMVRKRPSGSMPRC